MTRFVVCGETLIDLVPSDDAANTSQRSNWMALSAGGPMNSAVALGKLGADVHFLGRLSTDAFGRQLRQHIDGAGVSLDLAVESEQATSLAVVSLDDRGVASYTFHFNDTANFGWTPEELPDLGAGDWLHIASLSCVVSPGAEALLEWVGSLECGVSYDVNVRPTVIRDPEEYWRRVEPWLRVVGERSGIFKGSDEDVTLLARSATAVPDRSSVGDPVAIAAGFVEAYGLGMAVITLGPEGVAAVESGGAVTRAAGFPVSVVDTVGAGDTFMAGFLDGWVGRELPLEAALRRGTAASSIVCGRRGPQPPTAAEVDALIAAGG